MIDNADSYHLAKYKKVGPNHYWNCNRPYCAYHLHIRQGEIVEYDPGMIETLHIPVGPGPGNILDGDGWMKGADHVESLYQGQNAQRGGHPDRSYEAGR